MSRVVPNPEWGPCKVDGCGEPIYVKEHGYCVAHYHRWRKYRNALHFPDPYAESHTKVALEARFWKNVDKGGECWEWTGSRSNGYGRTVIGSKATGTRRSIGAHRLSWLLHFGPIADGFQVCHTCDNRSCVRPAHLFLGTSADNNHDRDWKGRAKLPPVVLGSARPSSRLTEEQVAEIRGLYATGLHSQQALANRYGIGQMTVSSIVRRQTWRHVA